MSCNLNFAIIRDLDPLRDYSNSKVSYAEMLSESDCIEISFEATVELTKRCLSRRFYWH